MNKLKSANSVLNEQVKRMRHSISEKEVSEKLAKLNSQVKILTSQLAEANFEKHKVLEKNRQEIVALTERNKMLLKVSRQERKLKLSNEREIEQLRRENKELKENQGLTNQQSLPRIITISDPLLPKKQPSSASTTSSTAN